MMKSRAAVWACIVLGNVIVQLFRIVSGLEPHSEQVFEVAYWTGFALSFHWAVMKDWI